MSLEKTCLDCGNLIKGRADKKFCDDQCRSNFNNRQKTGEPAVVKKINSILKKNRAIIEKLSPEGKAKTTKEKLTKAGFNFSYITHTYQTQKGTLYYYCYDYGYLYLENDWFLLIRNVSEID